MLVGANTLNPAGENPRAESARHPHTAIPRFAGMTRETRRTLAAIAARDLPVEESPGAVTVLTAAAAALPLTVRQIRQHRSRSPRMNDVRIGVNGNERDVVRSRPETCAAVRSSRSDFGICDSDEYRLARAACVDGDWARFMVYQGEGCIRLRARTSSRESHAWQSASTALVVPRRASARSSREGPVAPEDHHVACIR